MFYWWHQHGYGGYPAPLPLLSIPSRIWSAMKYLDEAAALIGKKPKKVEAGMSFDELD